MRKAVPAVSEELVVNNCSPTMAGLKTGNLFACTYECKRRLYESIRQFNHCLTPRGVRMIPVKAENGRALIYVYRPERLSRDLCNKQAREILAECGYGQKSVDSCLRELIRRLRCGGGFPHEIGLFLGYPPEDVDGFLHGDRKAAKCVGAWKVFGDVESARRKFLQFEKCTRVYREVYRRTRSFEKLVVRAS